MTQPPVELVDPGSAFLASHDPQRFLDDNLPSEPVLFDGEEEHHHRLLAVGIAGAFLAWRAMAAHQLRAMTPPATTHTLPTLVDRLTRPLWLQAATPVIDKGLADLGDTVVMQAAGESIGQRLGIYLVNSSVEALVAGYIAELGRGVAPQLAWARPALAFGLESRAMRSWLLAQQRDGGYRDTVLPPSANRALARLLMQRADTLGQSEAWSARAQARTLLWINQQRRGLLPADAVKRWLTAHDERVCAICGPLHEQEQPLSEPFRLKDDTPVWAPGLHPNCRCWIELVHGGMEQLLEKRMPLEVVRKDSGDDHYNRDKRGHFARRESRGGRRFASLARQAQVLDRPVIETAPAPAPVIEPAVPTTEAPPATESAEPVASPFASTGVASPFTQASVASPFGQTATVADPFAPVASPFAVASPFTQTETASPFAPPQTQAEAKTRTKTHHIVIIRRGHKGEEIEEKLPDDQLLMASVDHYHAAFEHWENEGQRLPGDELGLEASHADIGKIVDFDVWGERRAGIKKPGERTVYPQPGSVGWTKAHEESGPGAGFPGYPAYVMPKYGGVKGILDAITEATDEAAEDAWSALREDSDSSGMGYYEAIEQASEEIFNPANFTHDIAGMSDEEVKHVFLEAGRWQEARDQSPDELRDRLHMTLMQGPEYPDDEELMRAYEDYWIGQDDTVRAAESAFTMKRGQGYFRVPEIFTFLPGNYRADRVAGWEDRMLQMHGKFRVVDVKTHRYRATSGEMHKPEWGKPFQIPEHPQVLKWREIVLEPVDEDAAYEPKPKKKKR